MSEIIAIGGDHAGFTYKQKLIEVLQKKGYEVKDFGPFLRGQWIILILSIPCVMQLLQEK